MRRTLNTVAVAVAAACLAAPAAQAQDPDIVNGSSGFHVPWQVALVMKEPDGSLKEPLPVFCGGTVRDATHVITAAHCLPDTNAAQLAVVAGLYDRAQPNNQQAAYGIPNAQRRDVSAITSHPTYELDGGKANDLAVLTLSSPLDLGNASSVRALPVVDAGSNDVDRVMLISGWGDTDPQTEGGQHPDELAYTTIKVFADSACSGYGAVFQAATMVCAGFTDNSGTTYDTCQGDSGGPLARYDGAGNAHTDFDVLVGVVSFGQGCADPNFPGVYAKLAHSDLNARAKDPNPPARLEPAGAPAISGTPTAGQTLTCGNGAWNDVAAQFAHEWLSAKVGADGKPTDVKSEGTGATLSLTDAHVGRSMTCEVRASNAGGYRTQQAQPVGPVAARPADPPPPPPPAPAPAPAPAAASSAAPAPVADIVPPRTAVTRRLCQNRRCTLTVAVSDSGGAGTKAAVTLTRLSGCRKGRKGARCRKTRRLTARRIAPGVFEIITPKLAPARYRFDIVGQDAAGGRSAPVRVVLSVTRRSTKSVRCAKGKVPSSKTGRCVRAPSSDTGATTAPVSAPPASQTTGRPGETGSAPAGGTAPAGGSGPSAPTQPAQDKARNDQALVDALKGAAAFKTYSGGGFGSTTYNFLADVAQQSDKGTVFKLKYCEYYYATGFTTSRGYYDGVWAVKEGYTHPQYPGVVSGVVQLYRKELGEKVLEAGVVVANGRVRIENGDVKEFEGGDYSHKPGQATTNCSVWEPA